MAEPGKGAGRSNYAGIRVTMTDPQTGAPPVLTVAVKARAWGWDEWTLLVPAWRPDGLPPRSSTREALQSLVTQLEWFLENTEDL